MHGTCKACEDERLVPMLGDCIFAVHKCSIEIEKNSCKSVPLNWSGKRWLLSIRRHGELFLGKSDVGEGLGVRSSLLQEIKEKCVSFLGKF